MKPYVFGRRVLGRLGFAGSVDLPPSANGTTSPSKLGSTGAFFFVLGLSPFSDGVRSQGTIIAVLLVVAVIGLAGSVATIASRDWPFFERTGSILLIVFGASAIWLLVQLLPLRWLGNPVWASVQIGLDMPLPAYISIDLPATTLELGRCLLSATVFLAAASIAVDRDDAQWLLPGLAVFATVYGLVVALGLDRSAAAPGVMIDVAALTVLLALSEILNVFERLLTGSRRINARLRLILVSTCSLIVIALCILTSGWRGSVSLLSLSGGGGATLLVIHIVRRIGLGAFSAVGAIVVLIGLSVSVLANLQTNHMSALVAFASPVPASLERTERMIADTPRFGIGGGAFASLEGLYRGIRDTRMDGAPTFVAKEAVELGLGPMVVEAIGLWIVFALLIKSAVDRTRDWVYAAAGAATLVGLGLASFLNAGTGNLTLLLLASAVLGLGASQQNSRRAFR